MAKKTYRTYHLKGLALHLIDEHYHPIDVYFNAGAQIDSTAKFTTGDEKVQKAIEACSGFGRDYYLEEVREDNPVDVGKNASEKHGNGGNNTTKGQTKEGKVLEKPIISNTPVEETDEGTEDEEDDSIISVADKSEAIEWLKEYYPDKGYTATKLRSKDAFEAACKECGVVFEIAE